MSKITSDLNHKQLEQIIEDLPMRDKIRLVRKLEKETLSQRWKQILRDIDARLKKFPISPKDILPEIQAYRKNKYA